MGPLAEYVTALLSAIGGGVGDPRVEIQHWLLGTTLWTILLVVTLRRWRAERQPRERILLWGFGFGAARDAVMVAGYSFVILGATASRSLPRPLSAFDHALSLVSMIAVSGAFIEYLLKEPRLTRRFFRISLTLSLGASALALAMVRVQGGMVHVPGIGSIRWYDLATHGMSALVLGMAMLLLGRERGWLKNVVVAAFGFFLLHDLLTFAQSAAPAAETTLHALRHGVRAAGIALLGYVYVRESNQDRLAALQRFKSLEESNRLLVDASPLGVLLHDEGRIVRANPAAAVLLRAARPEDLLGMHVMDFVPQEGKKLVADRYRDLHEDPRKLPAAEYEITVLDGGRVAVEMVSQSFFHEGRLRVLTILRDISERRRSQAELRQAKEELEHKYEQLRQLDVIKDGLLRDVTHELKTPVAKQAMQLELLRNTLGKDCRAAVSGIVEVMERSVRRQEEVIRNLLDLSRLQAGGRVYAQRPVRADAVVFRVADDYRLSLEAGGGTLDLHLEPVEVLGEEEMLWHVLSNVVNNAIKFRRKDRPGRVAVRVGREGTEGVIRIIDNGVGLRSQDLEHVFDTFYQVSASVEGSGVGLSICKRIVEGMGGSIRLESDGPGKGTTAVVRLPLAGD